MVMVCRLVNLTPHEIVVMTSDKQPLLRLPPSGQVARVAETVRVVGEEWCVDDTDPQTPRRVPSRVSIIRKVLDPDAVTGLPEPRDGVLYVTSLIVAQAVQGRRLDVLAVGETVRDEAGRIVGCLNLAVV